MYHKNNKRENDTHAATHTHTEGERPKCKPKTLHNGWNLTIKSIYFVLSVTIGSQVVHLNRMHPGQNRLLWPNRASTRLLNLNRMLCRTRKQYEHFKTLLRTRPTGNSNAFSKQITSHFDSNSNVILRESCLKSLMLTCRSLAFRLAVLP